MCDKQNESVSINSKIPQPVDIGLTFTIWLPCNKCKLTTRHIFLNPSICETGCQYMCSN